MKKFFLVFSLACFSTAAFAQKTVYDSLFQLAERSANRAEKSRILLDAGFALAAWKPFPTDSVAAFSRHLKNIFPDKNTPEGLQATVLLLESKAAERSGAHETGLEKGRASKNIFEKMGGQRGLTAVNRVIIDCLSALGQASEAIELSQKVFEAAATERDTALMVDMCMSLGHNMVTTKQFTEAEDYQKRALLLSKNNTKTTALVQFYLGNLYLMSHRLDSAVAFFEKAAFNFRQTGDSANVNSTAMQLCAV